MSEGTENTSIRATWIHVNTLPTRVHFDLSTADSVIFVSLLFHVVGSTHKDKRLLN